MVCGGGGVRVVVVVVVVIAVALIVVVEARKSSKLYISRYNQILNRDSFVYYIILYLVVYDK